MQSKQAIDGATKKVSVLHSSGSEIKYAKAAVKQAPGKPDAARDYQGD
jgi:hypothetical protein